MDEGGVDGYTADELLSTISQPSKRSRKKSPRNHAAAVVCPHCGKTGHERKNHRECGMNPKNPNNFQSLLDQAAVVPSAVASGTNNDDADDVDAMDHMPLQDDPPSDFDEDIFHDARTWSDDEEEDFTIHGGIL